MILLRDFFKKLTNFYPMSSDIRIRKGLDIHLEGEAGNQAITTLAPVWNQTQ